MCRIYPCADSAQFCACLQTTIHVWYRGGTLDDKIVKGIEWRAKDRAYVSREIFLFVDKTRSYIVMTLGRDRLVVGFKYLNHQIFDVA